MAEGSFVSVVAVTTEHNVAKRTAWRSDTLNFGVAEGSVPRWQGSVVDSGAAEYGGGQFSRCGGMTEQNVAAKRSWRRAERSSLVVRRRAWPGAAAWLSVTGAHRADAAQRGAAPRGGMKRSRWPRERQRGVVELSITQWRSVAWRHEAQRGGMKRSEAEFSMAAHRGGARRGGAHCGVVACSAAWRSA